MDALALMPWAPNLSTTVKGIPSNGAYTLVALFSTAGASFLVSSANLV
jgi:hypothetical protein